MKPKRIVSVLLLWLALIFLLSTMTAFTMCPTQPLNIKPESEQSSDEKPTPESGFTVQPESEAPTPTDEKEPCENIVDQHQVDFWTTKSAEIEGLPTEQQRQPTEELLGKMIQLLERAMACHANGMPSDPNDPFMKGLALSRWVLRQWYSLPTFYSGAMDSEQGPYDGTLEPNAPDISAVLLTSDQAAIGFHARGELQNDYSAYAEWFVKAGIALSARNTEPTLQSTDTGSMKYEIVGSSDSSSANDDSYAYLIDLEDPQSAQRTLVSRMLRTDAITGYYYKHLGAEQLGNSTADEVTTALATALRIALREEAAAWVALKSLETESFHDLVWENKLNAAQRASRIATNLRLISERWDVLPNNLLRNNIGLGLNDYIEAFVNAQFASQSRINLVVGYMDEDWRAPFNIDKMLRHNTTLRDWHEDIRRYDNFNIRAFYEFRASALGWHTHLRPGGRNPDTSESLGYSDKDIAWPARTLMLAVEHTDDRSSRVALTAEIVVNSEMYTEREEAVALKSSDDRTIKGTTPDSVRLVSRRFGELTLCIMNASFLDGATELEQCLFPPSNDQIICESKPINKNVWSTLKSTEFQMGGHDVEEAYRRAILSIAINSAQPTGVPDDAETPRPEIELTLKLSDSLAYGTQCSLSEITDRPSFERLSMSLDVYYKVVEMLSKRSYIVSDRVAGQIISRGIQKAMNEIRALSDAVSVPYDFANASKIHSKISQPMFIIDLHPEIAGSSGIDPTTFATFRHETCERARLGDGISQAARSENWSWSLEHLKHTNPPYTYERFEAAGWELSNIVDHCDIYDNESSDPLRECGNHICDPGENFSNCRQDCSSPPAVCGNGKCEFEENKFNCSQDCGGELPNCGNGRCEAGEDSSNCPNDCPPPRPVCGNGECEFGENATTCSKDCGVPPPICGDRKCQDGENSSNCPKDCGPPPPICGNRKCEGNEDAVSCPQDCTQGEPEQINAKRLGSFSVYGTDSRLYRSNAKLTLERVALAFSNVRNLADCIENVDVVDAFCTDCPNNNHVGKRYGKKALAQSSGATECVCLDEESKVDAFLFTSYDCLKPLVEVENAE